MAASGYENPPPLPSLPLPALRPLPGRPAAGRIALSQTDGTFAYTSTANNGFWCEANGNVGNWGDTAPVYVEFSGLTMTYGHRKGVSVAGQKYMLKPTLIYTRNGVQYKATIVLNMQF